MNPVRGLFPFLLFPLLLSAQTPQPTADEIIAKIDANQTFNTEKYSAKMIISKGSRKIIKTFNGYAMRAGKKSFMNFTNPEDRGVKYLKIGDDLWIYLPDAQDSLKISGHMLRQGMMGSDLSYEDMLSSDKLQDRYLSRIIGKTNIDGKSCTTLEMTAKVENVTYFKRTASVDDELFIVRRVGLYAKTGRLLKQMEFDTVKEFSGRFLATRFTVRDMIRANTSTVIEFTDLALDAPLGESAFSRSVLSP
jgi:outer membrane lipoprotein-sorting protein